MPTQRAPNDRQSVHADSAHVVMPAVGGMAAFADKCARGLKAPTLIPLTTTYSHSPG